MVAAGLACNVFSFEANASNNARPDLAVDVLVVPREQELDRDGDPPRRLDQGLVHEEPPPKTAAVIRGSTAVNGTPIAVPNDMPPP